jgi:predicted LPLAT superfamily acyltransferase
MSEWTGKTRGGLQGYKSFVFILKYAGISTAYFVLRFVVVYFLLFAPRAVKSSYYFFRKRLNYSTFKSVRYIGRAFYKLGQVLIDKIAFLSGLNDKYTFDLDGENYLIEMANNSGGILIGAHAGSWEIASHFLTRVNCRINIVMFADEHKKIQNYLADIYKKQNVNFIAVGKDDYSHLFQISEALKNKEIIAIHGDRFLPGSRTLEKEFLNKLAEFPAGPFLLPIKFDVPVSYVMAMKETSKHYHFYASTPKKFSAPKNPEDRISITNQILEDYILNLEKILMKYPDQWFNFYDFWDDIK